MPAETPTQHDLDPDGLAEYLAQDIFMESQGAPVFGYEFLEAHLQFCPGCLRCKRILREDTEWTTS